MDTAQLVTDTADFAARLLRIVLQQYPMERLKHLITHFRFIPTISTNPMTNGIEVSFQHIEFYAYHVFI